MKILIDIKVSGKECWKCDYYKFDECWFCEIFKSKIEINPPKNIPKRLSQCLTAQKAAEGK